MAQHEISQAYQNLVLWWVDVNFFLKKAEIGGFWVLPWWHELRHTQINDWFSITWHLETFTGKRAKWSQIPAVHLCLWYRKCCLSCPVSVLVTNILSNWVVGLILFFFFLLCGGEVEMTQVHCVHFVSFIWIHHVLLKCTLKQFQITWCAFPTRCCSVADCDISAAVGQKASFSEVDMWWQHEL